MELHQRTANYVNDGRYRNVYQKLLVLKCQLVVFELCHTFPRIAQNYRHYHYHHRHHNRQ